MNTGLNRNNKEQYYTIQDVSNLCINYFMDAINTNAYNDIIIEPSAGEGSFSDTLHKYYNNVYSYDIDPKKEYIIRQDFLSLDLYQFKDKIIHTIGNPPFGRQSYLARLFIKKACEFSKTISFILPKSFRKPSYQKSFSDYFHLVYECNIQKNAFIINGAKKDVPCIFQIWEKKDYKRYSIPNQYQRGFKFIQKPNVIILKEDHNGNPLQKKNVFNEDPDFAIRRAGGGKKCGSISLQWDDGIQCTSESWLFIKLNSNYNKQRFYTEYKHINWEDDSNVGPRSIDKPTFIKGINHLIDRLYNIGPNIINYYNSSKKEPDIYKYYSMYL